MRAAGGGCGQSSAELTRFVELAKLVQLGDQLVARSGVTRQQPTPTVGGQGSVVQQLLPPGVGAVEQALQRNREGSYRIGVELGEQLLDVELGQSSDGRRSSIAHGAPCSDSIAMNGAASNASGPLIPSPFHTPVAISSRAMTGWTAVCQTTAW